MKRVLIVEFDSKDLTAATQTREAIMRIPQYIGGIRDLKVTEATSVPQNPPTLEPSSSVPTPTESTQSPLESGWLPEANKWPPPMVHQPLPAAQALVGERQDEDEQQFSFPKVALPEDSPATPPAANSTLWTGPAMDNPTPPVNMDFELAGPSFNREVMYALQQGAFTKELADFFRDCLAAMPEGNQKIRIIAIYSE